MIRHVHCNHMAGYCPTAGLRYLVRNARTCCVRSRRHAAGLGALLRVSVLCIIRGLCIIDHFCRLHACRHSSRDPLWVLEIVCGCNQSQSNRRNIDGAFRRASRLLLNILILVVKIYQFHYT